MFNYKRSKQLHVHFAGHIQAPELQKVYLIAPATGAPCEVAAQHLNVPPNGWLNMTQAEAVRAYRKLNRVPVRVGRYCRVKVTLQGKVLQTYQGYVASYADVLRFKRRLRIRHNLPHTTFEFSTQYIGG